MSRSIFAHSLVILVGLLLGASPLGGLVQAQEQEDEYHEPRRPRSLSQRLEQFRKDLLGDREAEEEDAEPVAPPRKPQSRMNSASRPNTNVKGHTVPSGPTSTRPTNPASRMVARERKPISEGVRVAAKPSNRETPFVEPVPERPTPANRNSDEPVIADETRPARLSSTSARPARKGGAFELPTPRVARSEQAEVPEGEDVEEQPFEEEIAEPAPPKSAGDGVLFTAKSPMLSVEATGPRKILVGREAQFNISLRNVGEVPASGVVVKVNIPAYAEVAAAEPSSGSAPAPATSEQPTTLEWKLDRLDVRGRETLSLKLVPRKSTPLDLGLQWTCMPETTQTVVEVQEPKLSLSLSGPREVFFGQSKIYKLTIANPGNGDAENVSVSLLPIGQSNDAPSNYRLGYLRAGDSKTIDIELTARQAGTLEIKAQAFGDNGLRAEVAEPVVVRRAQLKIAVGGSKVKYAGTPGIYRIRVANAGDAVAEGVELSVMLPPDAKFLKASGGGKHDDAGAKVVWQIGVLQPGDDHTYDVHCSLGSPGDNSVQAIVRAGDDLTASATTVTHVDALADLKLEVRDPQGPVPVGEDAKYEVIVRNRGTKAAEGIEIVSFFSEGLEATRVEGAEHQISPGQVVMKTIPSIGPGAEASVHVHCKSDRGGNLVFRAEVTCRNPGTKLAAEETTHFYGDDTAAEESVEDEATISEEPTPAAEEPESRYPTRAK